jgi:hypothetical protein
MVAAQAKSSVRARSSLYQDDDATVVSTSVVAANAAVSDAVSVDAHGLVDIISTASIDVVAAATKRWHEVRKEAEGGLSFADGTTTLGGSYIYSTENDWSSHTLNLGLSRDLLVHDLTLGLGGSYVDNNVGRSHDKNFAKKLSVVSGNASVVWVQNPRNLWSANYTLSYLDGYQGSVYRYVRFRDAATASLGQSIAAPEGDFTPQTRARHAITLRWNHALFEDSALRSHVRFYRDDWGVTSVTGGTEYVVGVAPWELAFFVRGYAQRHADFYQDLYARQMRYMTADRKLSTFYDLFFGPRVTLRYTDVGPFSDLSFELKLTAFGFRFTEFAALPERNGYIAEIGATGAF